MSESLPTVADLCQDLPGIWLNDATIPGDLTFKLFGLCKKKYLTENDDVKEPLTLHALGYIAPIPFHLTTDNGFCPDKDLPSWCKSPLQAILKSHAWCCWLEWIPETSPINDNFDNVMVNMVLLKNLAATHAASLLRYPITAFGSTVVQSGNGSIVLKHTMLVVSSDF